MKAMEGRHSGLHRRDWIGFLTRMIPAHVWQTFSAALPPRAHGNQRWTAKYVVEALAVIGWSLQPTLQERFREARQHLVRRYVRRRRPGATWTGLVEAARGLGVSSLQAFWACLRPTLPQRTGEAWCWRGWELFAVDGSREDAPRTQAHQDGLGQSSKNGARPQFWMTWLVHLPTLSLWDWRQGPGDSSERQHLLEMLPGLPTSALVVADAGFTGFDFLRAIVASGRHFLVRCGGNVKLLVEGCVQKMHQEGDHRYVYLWPQERGHEEPLKMRLIVLKQAGQAVYLLTNVLESTRLSRRTASLFYRARWGVEVNYRAFKQTLQRRQVLARTPESGDVELAGAILAMGLLRMHAALALGAKMVRVSIAGLLRIVRRALEAVRCGLRSDGILDELRAAFIDDYRRRTGKAARDWPHKKRESPPKPPKLRRLTKRHQDQMAWLIHHRTAQIT